MCVSPFRVREGPGQPCLWLLCLLPQWWLLVPTKPTVDGGLGGDRAGLTCTRAESLQHHTWLPGREAVAMLMMR